MRLERQGAVYAVSIAVAVLVAEGLVAVFGLTTGPAFLVGSAVGFIGTTVATMALYDWTHEPRRSCEPVAVPCNPLDPPRRTCMHGNYDHRSPWSISQYCCETALDIAYAKSPVRPKVDGLPTFRVAPKCPKCHGGAVETVYCAGAHVGCPDSRMYLSASSYLNADAIAIQKRKVESGIEHHDRSCLICKHCWVEAVA